MSSFEIQKLPDEPIILCVFSPEWRTDRDLRTLIEQTIAIFDSMDERIYYLVDFRQVTLGLGDVLPGATAVARGSNAMLHHPNLIEFVGITEDKLITMSVKGLNSDAFGNVPTSVALTLEEALAAVRAKIAA